MAYLSHQCFPPLQLLPTGEPPTYSRNSFSKSFAFTFTIINLTSISLCVSHFMSSCVLQVFSPSDITSQPCCSQFHWHSSTFWMVVSSKISTEQWSQDQSLRAFNNNFPPVWKVSSHLNLPFSLSISHKFSAITQHVSQFHIVHHTRA